MVSLRRPNTEASALSHGDQDATLQGEGGKGGNSTRTLYSSRTVNVSQPYKNHFRNFYYFSTNTFYTNSLSPRTRNSEGTHFLTHLGNAGVTASQSSGSARTKQACDPFSTLPMMTCQHGQGPRTCSSGFGTNVNVWPLTGSMPYKVQLQGPPSPAE